MFTSRAEFRLHLRIDNADRRLTPHGRRSRPDLGRSLDRFPGESNSAWRDMKKLLERTKFTAAMLAQPCGNEAGIANAHVGTAAPGGPAEQSSAPRSQLSSATGQSLAQLLKRPEVTIEQLVPVLKELNPEFFAKNSSVSGALVENLSGRSSSLRSSSVKLSPKSATNSSRWKPKSSTKATCCSSSAPWSA